MKLPVIFYHAIHLNDNADTEKYSVGVDQFSAQIGYLSEHGFSGVLLDDLFKDRPTASGKHIAITFDDGAYSDFNVASPILQKYGFSATFFITVNYIGTKGYLGWDDILKMSRMGMSIQSHSLNHVFLSDLDEKSLYTELSESKRLIEERIDKPVHYISLPGGFCSERVLSAAKQCGYKAVCTSAPGYNETAIRPNDFLILNRMLVTRKTGLEAFARTVEGNSTDAAYAKGLHMLKTLARMTLGSRAYYALWSMLFKEVK